MTSETAIALAPWVQLLQPIVTTVVIGGIGVLASQVAPCMKRWFHVQIDQAAVDTLRQKAQTVAGQMIAADAQNLAGKSITASNPTIVAAACAMSADLPVAEQLSGWNPERLAKLIAGELGKLQATQSTTETVALVAPSAPPATR